MKRLLPILLLVALLMTGCFRKDPTGEILLLKDDIYVGDTVAMAFSVPEAFDDLHMEMWSCELKTDTGIQPKFEYLIENGMLEDDYTQTDVERLFIDSPVDIYRDDKAMECLYTPRIALFTPKESGTYIIGVAGYYHTTSPSYITQLEVLVHEKE
ncbi:MAG: hypothetical protein JXO44_06520 [Clostridia bacterium]|nr:hypothetical protein [Clostridia bacterium]